MNMDELHGVDFFRWKIAEKLVVAFPQVTVEQLYEMIETPNNTANGDLSLPIPKLNKLFKVGNPAQAATAAAAAFVVDEFTTACQAGGAFLNFRINKSVLVQRTIKDVLKAGKDFGNSTMGNGKSVIVEYSSPNIAKPFHAGHLRSTIIGSFIANLHDKLGYKVVRINYLGDWGKQYGLLAVGFSKFGSEEKLQADPIKHLFDVYVAINKEAERVLKETGVDTINDEAREYFKRMEDGEEDAIALWRRFRDLSIVKYHEIYDRLNVRFDVYSGESMYGEAMKAILTELAEKEIIEDDKGASIVDLGKALGRVVVRKQNGTTLYITRDIAAAIARYKEYNFDEMYYVVAAPQDLHFRQLFAILEKMGYKDLAAKCHHVSFGMVHGMSTRKGEVVFLEDILQEAASTMHEVMKRNEDKYKQIENPEAVADVVGMSAVTAQDMSARRIKDYTFDWPRMTNYEGDTGPYLQFAHARICSIERKIEQSIPTETLVDADFSLLSEPVAIALVESISRYPAVLKLALSNVEPNTVMTYCMQLSHSISAALDALRVVGAEPEVARARAAMYKAARMTLSSGLEIVCIRPLERM